MQTVVIRMPKELIEAIEAEAKTRPANPDTGKPCDLSGAVRAMLRERLAEIQREAARVAGKE